MTIVMNDPGDYTEALSRNRGLVSRKLVTLDADGFCRIAQELQ